MTDASPRLKKCTSCGEFKPFEEFSHAGRGYRSGKCKPCFAAYARQRRLADLDSAREKDRRYREANPERVREAQRRSRAANPDTARRWRRANPEAVREAERKWRLNNPEKARERERKNNTSPLTRIRSTKRRAANRDAVFAHYGTLCACCGSESNLQIDHMAGVNSVPQTVPRSGTGLYYWLVTYGFPEGFQTLCRRCNRSKSKGTHCTLPHNRRGAAAPNSGTPADSIPTQQEEP